MNVEKRGRKPLLTVEQMEQIRAHCAAIRKLRLEKRDPHFGETQTSIAARFGVSLGVIQKIVRGRPYVRLHALDQRNTQENPQC